MNRKYKHPKNNGWTNLNYDFGLDPELTQKLNKILNEACHIFHHHPEGVWESDYKDAYASMIATELKRTPPLIRKLLGTEDRVIKMLTYRAIELNKIEKET